MIVHGYGQTIRQDDPEQTIDMDKLPSFVIVKIKMKSLKRERKVSIVYGNN